MIEFKFKHLRELQMSVKEPKSSSSRTSGMIEFKFKYLRKLQMSVN